MYAEVNVNHSLEQPNLCDCLESPRLGQPLPGAEAKGLSRIYRGDDKITFDAGLQTGGETLVLARWCDSTLTVFHVERNGRRRADTILRLTDDVQRITRNIVKALDGRKARPRVSVVRLFEDTGNASGVEARPRTLSSYVKDELMAVKWSGPIALLLSSTIIFSLNWSSVTDLKKALVSAGIALGVLITYSLVRVLTQWIGSGRRLLFRFSKEA